MMTPMIDVVFQLLIFFVCGAAGSIQEAVLATDLSATGGVASVVQPPEEREAWKLEIRLRVERDPASGAPAVDMNGTRYTDFDPLERTLQSLAAIEAENPVILDVGPGVAWGTVIDLYDRCRRAGLKSVNFAVDAANLVP